MPNEIIEAPIVAAFGGGEIRTGELEARPPSVRCVNVQTPSVSRGVMASRERSLLDSTSRSLAAVEGEPDESLSDNADRRKLASLWTEINAATTPAERDRLAHEITKLQSALKSSGNSPEVTGLAADADRRAKKFNKSRGISVGVDPQDHGSGLVADAERRARESKQRR